MSWETLTFNSSSAIAPLPLRTTYIYLYIYRGNTVSFDCVVPEKKAAKRHKGEKKTKSSTHSGLEMLTVQLRRCLSSSSKTQDALLWSFDHPKPRGIHVGGCTRARFDRGFERRSRRFPVLFLCVAMMRPYNYCPEIIRMLFLWTVLFIIGDLRVRSENDKTRRTKTTRHALCR